MYFEQFYLGCLAHASYLIGSEGEAAVVDPRRDVDDYLRVAAEHGLTIRYVVETHLHADFVSGHRELAERTGARIVFSRRAGAALPHLPVADGDEVRLGTVVLRFLETPGHTPESLSVVVIDTAVSLQPRMVLTGDTLFVGDVGRPDLVGGQGLTPEHMAGLLFDSLHEKILALPDAVEVYPAHGAGSLCGKNISKETSSTVGAQRRGNWALQPMAREEFVRLMTRDLPEVPRYFPMDVALNREGARPLAALPAPPALEAAAVERLRTEGALVLDVRPAAEFGAGHVPGALNIALGGQFASWAGTLLDPARRLILAADGEEHAREAATRLARVGLEAIAGWVAPEAWARSGREVRAVPQITVDMLRDRLRSDPSLQVIDVRRAGEYTGGHVPGARHLSLDRLEPAAAGLDPSRPTAVICAGGYRSSAGTSLLAARGFRDLVNVTGGTAAWVAAGFEVEREASSGGV
ncbi:MAG: MBL fold metallo-hydrolase [Acidobacteria bacterium]|nr:MAG: MBL fold metallo-hydrolase [Acidobacteriota bacterium]